EENRDDRGLVLQACGGVTIIACVRGPGGTGRSIVHWMGSRWPGACIGQIRLKMAYRLPFVARPDAKPLRTFAGRRSYLGIFTMCSAIATQRPSFFTQVMV